MSKPTHPDGVFRRAILTSAASQTVRRLAEVCEAAEGLTLKLTYGAGRHNAAPEDGMAFLAYRDGALVGYCALDYGGDSVAELCGMVHPDWRRKGIGSALLQTAMVACQGMSVTTLLLICERASASGQAFVASCFPSTSPPHSAEHHMKLAGAEHITAAIQAGTANLPSSFQTRFATPNDLDALANITASAFDDPIEEVRRRITLDFESGAERWMIGLVDSELLGSLRAETTPYATEREMGVYGFGVRRDRQGQGWGRRILMSALAMLRDEGAERFSLEVDTTNAPALALYRSCGFAVVTTYEYYLLPVSRTAL